MPRRHRSALTPFLAGAAVVLSGLVYAHAETVRPDQIAYVANVNEDPAAKACMLSLAIKDDAVSETVRFQLVVARMKREDATAGPAMFGFTIEVDDPRHAAPRGSSARALAITSAAFASERYAAAAHPKTPPFADGSWVASTLDAVQGGALVGAAVEGKFQIAYTRTRPSAARIYEVASAPPPDVQNRFSSCIGGLQGIE